MIAYYTNNRGYIGIMEKKMETIGIMELCKLLKGGFYNLGYLGLGFRIEDYYGLYSLNSLQGGYIGDYMGIRV